MFIKAINHLPGFGFPLHRLQKNTAPLCTINILDGETPLSGTVREKSNHHLVKKIVCVHFRIIT